MYRVSALLPSWDRSKQSAASDNNNNNTSNSNSNNTGGGGSGGNTDTSSSPLPPKSPGALDKVFGWAEKIVPGSRISISAATTTTTATTKTTTATTASTTTTPAPATRTRYRRETYWPTTLDKECDKAARIIKSFCCKSPSAGSIVGLPS